MKSRRRRKRSRSKADGVNPYKLGAMGLLAGSATIPSPSAVSLYATPYTTTTQIISSPESFPSYTVIAPDISIDYKTLKATIDNLKNNSFDFLRLYKRLDDTRKEIKRRIASVPKGYEKDKYNDSLTEIEDLLKDLKRKEEEVRNESPAEASCIIA
jgi:hypothetical protein